MGATLSARRDSSLGISLAAALIGLLSAGVGVATGNLHPTEVWSMGFPPGPWRVALFATSILWGLALAAYLLQAGLAWWARTKGPLYQIPANASVEETLLAIQQHVQLCMSTKDPDVSSALDVLLRGGLVLGASDLHFNPLAGELTVTFRIDGVLHTVTTLPGQWASRLSRRVKVLARLDSFTNDPQDGSLRRVLGDLKLEARVSILPANHGERVVLRLVRGGEAVTRLDHLGFDPETTKKFKQLLRRPQGIFYVSGPVGSGKTTTLYSMLQELHLDRGDTTSIVTLEDPIEVQLPFATQTQINRKVAMDFAQTLRSVLRQDPGALMLGEVRDKETAEIATQAGLTGHMILTTVHVQSAAGTFARLIEMDVEPFVLASSCNASLAQRLVRRLCPECARPASVTPELSERFAQRGVILHRSDYLEPMGCPKCEKRGYLGRLPVAELLIVSEAIQEAIRRRASSEEIHRLAVSEGMSPLIHAALDRANAGETSLEEVLRVAG
jgi:general secretion pathway protein E